MVQEPRPRKHGDSPVAVGLSLAVNRPARTGIDPRAFSCSVGRAQVAPHGRGWTLMSLGTVRGIRGRPARTGIDRNLTATLPGRRRVPRTHGGGPRCTPSQPPRPATDPARTGIYLRWMWESTSSGALPRTHGERPKNYASGWTGSDRFPARTGVDQCAGVCMFACMRTAPRSHGGTPRGVFTIRRIVPAPAHAEPLPARTGINRTQNVRPGEGERQPRAHGDQPRTVATTVMRCE